MRPTDQIHLKRPVPLFLIGAVGIPLWLSSATADDPPKERQDVRSLVGHKAPVGVVAFSPDGKLALSMDQSGEGRLWDVSTAKEKARLVGHKGRVTSAVFSPDGKHLLSAGADQTVRPTKPEQPRDPDLGDLAYPPKIEGAQVEIYKAVGDAKLRLNLFTPENHKPAKRPAIVFFFGGGLRSGNPRQFEQQSRYLAKRGMVAVLVDYRVTKRHNTKGIDSMRDAKSAIRWVRANADRLGIDPDRLAAGGGSAGGWLAGITGVVAGLDEPAEDAKISSVPNALVLFNPFLVAVKVEGSGLDYPPDISESAGIEPTKVSPYHHVRAGGPPTIIFHGKADKTVPYRTAEMFTEKMTKAGNRRELVGYENADHGFFNYRWGDGTVFVDTVHRMDRFLVSLGYLKGEPLPLDVKDASRAARPPSAVPLRVNVGGSAAGRAASTRSGNGAGTAALPAGWPVTTGVPFKEGQFTDKQIGSLRLVTDGDNPVPAQFEVRGRYPGSKSIRWLGVEFQLLADAKQYRLLLDGGRDARAPEPARPVSGCQGRRSLGRDDKRSQGGNTPKRRDAARLAQGRIGPGTEGGHGNWLTTAKGARHSEQGLHAEIEREGPLHSTVRVTGRYVDDQGRPSCKWSAALHFYAGRPEIEITHTFTWVGHSDDLQIKDLALTFGLKDPATSALVDKSHAIGDGAHETALKDGGMLSLLQDDLWHHGHGKNHFAISAGTPEQPRELAQGERGGCWISGTGPKHTVLLAFRDLWQQFPSELRVTPREVTAYFWSTNGRAPAFDLRPAAMEEFFGKDFSQLVKQEQWITNRLANRVYLDPTGLAKTHDLLLRFEPPSAGIADLQVHADTFDNVPLVYPDPEWTWRSGAAGNLGPKDEAKFPELEKGLNHDWDLALGAVETWGDYGFLFHGDGPHQSYLRTSDGVLRATPHRFGSCYGISKAAWLAYLRSGERRLYEYAFAHSRFLNDVTFAHENTASRIKGDFSGIPRMPWVGWSLDSRDFMTGKHPVKANYHTMGFTFYIEHALFYYYLTGDPRSLEVAKDYAGALKEYVSSIPDWDKVVAGYVGAEWSRGFAHRLGDFVVLYEALNDPWFLDQAHRVARHLIDLDRPAGIRHWPKGNGGKEPAPYPRYIFYLGPHLMRYLRVLPQGEEAERVKKALVKMAEFELRIERFHWGNGDLMAKAYELTNDPAYLAHGLKRLRRDAANAAAQGPLERRPGLMGIGEAVLGHAVEYTAAIVGALRERPDLELPADTRVLQKSRLAPAAEMVFEKQAGESLRIELVAQGEEYADPDRKSFPAEWTRLSITYHAMEWDVPLVYREVVVPAEAPAGEYRIKLDVASRCWVLRTSARRYVLAAPDGFEIEGRTNLPWYFQVPKDAKTLTVRASSFNGVAIQDSSGAAGGSQAGRERLRNRRGSQRLGWNVLVRPGAEYRDSAGRRGAAGVRLHRHEAVLRPPRPSGQHCPRVACRGGSKGLSRWVHWERHPGQRQ